MAINNKWDLQSLASPEFRSFVIYYDKDVWASVEKEIPFDSARGHRMVPGDASHERFRDCHHPSREASCCHCGSDEFVFQSAWPSSLQPSVPKKLNRAEILFSFYDTCISNILFFLENNLSILLCRVRSMWQPNQCNCTKNLIGICKRIWSVQIGVSMGKVAGDIKPHRGLSHNLLKSKRFVHRYN